MTPATTGAPMKSALLSTVLALAAATAEAQVLAPLAP